MPVMIVEPLGAVARATGVPCMHPLASLISGKGDAISGHFSNAALRLKQ